MRTTVQGRSLVAGSARGPVLWLDEPLSFWGGVDPASGRILDGRHPQEGSSVTAKILGVPYGRGSSSSPSVLAEMIRRGTAPAGILTAETDAILVLGALVAAELYAVVTPVVVVSDPPPAGASEARIAPDGRVQFR